MKYKRIPPNEEGYFTWENQVRQYPPKGDPGIGYFKGILGDDHWVDCLLFRNNKGDLIGILNYYNRDEYVGGLLAEKKGNFNVFVKPEERRKGIGKQLMAEAIKRFGAILEDQLWTPSGFKMLQSFLKIKQ